MNYNDTQISLTYTLRGESLVKAGVYQAADISVFRSFQKDEVVKVNKPMKIIERAKYNKATQEVTLSNAFVRMALDLPRKPENMNFHKWLRTPLGKAAQNWKKLSDKQKLDFHIEQYVQDMGGEDFIYEIL